MVTLTVVGLRPSDYIQEQLRCIMYLKVWMFSTLRTQLDPNSWHLGVQCPMWLSWNNHLSFQPLWSWFQWWLVEGVWLQWSRCYEKILLPLGMAIECVLCVMDAMFNFRSWGLPLFRIVLSQACWLIDCGLTSQGNYDHDRRRREGLRIVLPPPQGTLMCAEISTAPPTFLTFSARDWIGNPELSRPSHYRQSYRDRCGIYKGPSLFCLRYRSLVIMCRNLLVPLSFCLTYSL